jgi:hypothetical protein
MPWVVRSKKDPNHFIAWLSDHKMLAISLHACKGCKCHLRFETEDEATNFLISYHKINPDEWEVVERH